MILHFFCFPGNFQHRFHIKCLCQNLCCPVKLFFQVPYFLRKHQSQMPTLQMKSILLRHITNHLNLESHCLQSLFDHLLHLRIQHRGNPVQNDSPDITVIPVFNHSLQYCQDCRCHTSCRNNQDYRKSQGSRNVISTCLIRIQTDPVIVPHHTFCHHKLRAFRMMHKPLFQALPVTKIQIQVLGINSQHLPVKHRINIIRSAFAGAYLLSGIFKCFHHCHCHRCLSTPTGRCRDYNSGNFHSVSPPSEII